MFRKGKQQQNKQHYSISQWFQSSVYVKYFKKKA